MKKKRLIWAKKYQDWTTEDWSKVLFSDETHFFVQGKRVPFVRRSSSDKISPTHLKQRVKHPLKVMFWDCFSFYSPGPLVPVIGMMNSEQYIDVLSTHMITELKKVYSSGKETFQQDLAPCHNSKKEKKFFEQKEIRLLELPGNSPDINPIKNLCAICKKNI